jgi:glutamate transport system permease protein
VLLAGAVLYVIMGRLADAGQLEPASGSRSSPIQVVLGRLPAPRPHGTLKAALLSVVFAGIFGLIFGMGRLSHIKAIRLVSGAIVEFFRSVPVLMMMIFLFFGYFATSTIVPADRRPLAAVVLALTLYNGSVIAELVRSGVHSLPKGQGGGGPVDRPHPAQTLRTIQLPQALTAMLPALISQFVVVLKDSALGTAITYQELLTWSKTAGSAYANTVPALIVCAALFIAINYGLTRVATWVERRLNRRGTTVEPRTCRLTAGCSAN